MGCEWILKLLVIRKLVKTTVPIEYTKIPEHSLVFKFLIWLIYTQIEKKRYTIRDSAHISTKKYKYYSKYVIWHF